MQIVKNKVVHIEYTLKDDDGDVIDSSVGHDPLPYLHGSGSIVPGLEAALEGRVLGDTINVTVAPGDGYGDHDPELVHMATRAQFGGADDIEVGMQFRADEDGGGDVVTVVAVEGENITLDGNHPLAGVTLHFEVKVMGVRDATAEELAHGHPHPGDGHHHH